MPRDNQGETAASIRMRMRRGWTDEARANTSLNCQRQKNDTPEWQAVMEALSLVVENSGPPMFARIGVMRALNRSVEHVFDPSRKRRQKLARYQRRKPAR
jgi:hypothetical protein